MEESILELELGWSLTLTADVNGSQFRNNESQRYVVRGDQVSLLARLYRVSMVEHIVDQLCC